MGGLGRQRIIRLAVVGLSAAIVLLAACDGDETPTPTAAAPSSEKPATTTAPATSTPTAYAYSRPSNSNHRTSGNTVPNGNPSHAVTVTVAYPDGYRAYPGAATAV